MYCAVKLDKRVAVNGACMYIVKRVDGAQNCMSYQRLEPPTQTVSAYIYNKLDQEKYEELPESKNIEESDKMTDSLGNVDRLVLHMLAGNDNEQTQG